MIGAAAMRQLCGAYWFRVGAVSLAAALVMTTLRTAMGLSTFLGTLPYALVHAATMGALAGSILPRVAHPLRGVSQPTRWSVLLPVLAGLAIAGTLVACGVLDAVGLEHGRGFWNCVSDDFGINVVMTASIGIGMVFYESQRARLVDLTLTLRTKELEHERASKMALEARLSSLESRLHPHFLFNTLNAISALIHDDPDRAERTVERLAALLRFSLDATERGMVPLAQELRIVTDYLEIEKTRLGERLTYTIDAPPDVAGFEVPPLIVQTLAENSVKHAIASRPDTGRVRVEASANGARVTISVWDDGPGFAPAAIVPGHGLENLQSRLAARFGSAASLGVSRQDGGTLVTISLPRAGVSERG